MQTRLLVLLCLVGCAWCDVYFPASCARCTTDDYIPKLPLFTGPIESASNRPYAWAIEAMIQTQRNHNLMTPPSVGRICGIVGSCLYEAAALVRRDIASDVKPGLKLPTISFNEEILTHAIDGAGFWAVRRLFRDTPHFDVVYDHYEAFSGKSIRDLEPVMERAVSLSVSPPRKYLYYKSFTYSEAIAAGAVACEKVIQKFTADGFTPRGDLTGPNPSTYRPRNSPQRLAGITDCDSLEAPGFWQPLCVPNEPEDYGTAKCTPQEFITDWAGRFTTFALEAGNEMSGRGSVADPPIVNSPDYNSLAEEVLTISGKLGDREKVLAEYWVDGPDFTMPAGHAWRIAADAALAEGLSQTETAKLLFFAGVALNDAGVAAWRVKTSYDFTRPLQMIQCGHLRGTVRPSWLGPYRGIGLTDVANFRPYQRPSFISPGFAGYTSGHSTFSGAFAEALKLYFGDDRYRGPSCDIVREGESLYEPKSNDFPGVSDVPNSGAGTPGYTPADNVVFCWNTWTEAARESGMSRLYGGVHVRTDDEQGRALGRRVAQAVYAKAQTLF